MTLQGVHTASSADLPSLRTIYARAFHPGNPYLRSAIPDTQATRQWWEETYLAAQTNPTEHDLVVREEQFERDEEGGPGGGVIGVIRLKQFEAHQQGIGFWTRPLSLDHDTARCEAFIPLYAEQRFKLSGHAPHIVITLLGTDHAYQRKGVGKALLLAAHDIADRAGLPVIVMTGKGAPFYERFGYECVDKVKMEGDIEYDEHVLIRQPKAMH